MPAYAQFPLTGLTVSAELSTCLHLTIRGRLTVKRTVTAINSLVFSNSIWLQPNIKPQLVRALRFPALLWCNSLDRRCGTSKWSPSSLGSTQISTSGGQKLHPDFINDFQVSAEKEGGRNKEKIQERKKKRLKENCVSIFARTEKHYEVIVSGL